MADPIQLYLRVYRLTFGGGQVPWSGAVAVAGSYYQLQPSAQVRLSDVGAWSVQTPIAVAAIPSSVPMTSETTIPRVGSMVLIRLFNANTNVETNIAAGIVENVQVAWVAADEAPLVTISGRTFGAILEDLIVYPVGGTSRKPFSDSRTFSWASPEYDDTAWTTAQEMTSYQAGSLAWVLDSGVVAPDGFPYSPNAKWIWHDNPGGATSSATNADLGTCLFRRTWTNPTTQRYAFFITGDNYYVFYIDGIEVAANRDDPYGWQSTTRFDCEVTSGAHVLAIRGENVAGFGGLNPGGVLLAVKVVNPDGTLTDPPSDGIGPIYTDAHWKCQPYVTAPYPGITFYKLWDTLIAEAAARDSDNTAAFRAVSAWRWTSTVDTAGTSWTELPEITVSVGASYLDVLRTLVDQAGMSFTDGITSSGQTTAETLSLSAWNQLPPDVDVATFSIGVDLMGLTYTTESG